MGSTTGTRRRSIRGCDDLKEETDKDAMSVSGLKGEFGGPQRGMSPVLSMRKGASDSRGRRRMWKYTGLSRFRRQHGCVCVCLCVFVCVCVCLCVFVCVEARALLQKRGWWMPVQKWGQECGG